MKTLLKVTAILETGIGFALATAPSKVFLVLLGSPLEAPGGPVVGRVLGASLVSLGAACWFARGDAQGQTDKGLIAALLLYNIAAASLLGYARIGLLLPGLGLWPAVILHSALAVWCVACLRTTRQLGSGS
jgi:hypothetical protein